MKFKEIVQMDSYGLVTPFREGIFKLSEKTPRLYVSIPSTMPKSLNVSVMPIILSPTSLY